MNKSSFKNFAVTARNELIQRIQQKAYELGITEDKVKKAQIEASDAIYINGQALDKVQVQQRNSLIKEIKVKGYSQVMEEAAYTWFNRFCALRFMEVNKGYLPTGVRVLSSTLPGSAEPDIMREALLVDLDLDREIIFALKEQNDDNGLFKYLLIRQCNCLHAVLPFLFEPVEDYTEILFPDNLLKEGSFLRVMVNPDLISEADWQDVEIIGWLYQYYIAEKKDQVFADLKKNIKISPENIPAATQLFTPHWIVRYLVENSLGRLWMLNHPESRLIKQMDYYIKPEQEDLDFLRISSPEEIKICDPACGSGHMLVYAFDLLYAIYEEAGYQPAEIPAKILAHNLYGIEIDERAGELAAFALTMKARSKYSRFFRKPVQPNICVLKNIHFEQEELQNYMDEVGHNLFTANLQSTLGQFAEAENFGSLIKPHLINISDVLPLLEVKDLTNHLFYSATHKKVLKALQQAEYLSPKYHVVIANPPYMGSKGMNGRLKVFAEYTYPDSKSDLFAMFIERGFDLIVEGGYNSMITMESWMFLSSFEKLREKIINMHTIESMVHMPYLGKGNTSMGINFGTSATIFYKNPKPFYLGHFSSIRYFETNENGIPFEFPVRNERLRYVLNNDFNKIPGFPIAYWISDEVRGSFKQGDPFSLLAEPRLGMATGNNDMYVRNWYEVSRVKIGINLTRDQARESGLKWFPYNKGGDFRRWFGNNEYVVNWENDGNALQNTLHPSGTRIWAHNFNLDYIFKPSITWTFISSSSFGVRYSPQGFLFDVAGSSAFPELSEIHFLLGFLGSKVAFLLLKALNPTLNFQAGNLGDLPIINLDHLSRSKVDKIVNELVEDYRSDWDSYEISLGFLKPLLLGQKYHQSQLKSAYTNFRSYSKKVTIEMQLLEEENNRIFIDAYGLQDELTPEVPLSEITLTCNPYYRYGADKSEEELEARLLLDTIKEYISYAVGCMFGRYSLDQEGLIYAGGNFDPGQYTSFPADQDNVIPILADDYFKDDIVTRFVDFIRITFSEDKLEENLDFIADTLGRKANETARDSIRRYFVNDFYKDHVQNYKKRPIYWMFTSGKEKAFNCLVYLHRYQPDTIATLRTDYLHRLQEALEVEKKQLQRIISEEAGSSSARSAVKRLVKLDKQILELKKYDELVHHYADMRVDLDLDDGVKVNYAKLDELLAKL